MKTLLIAAALVLSFSALANRQTNMECSEDAIYSDSLICYSAEPNELSGLVSKKELKKGCEIIAQNHAAECAIVKDESCSICIRH